MNQQAIFGPFFSMMYLTLIVWLYMYSRRIPFITRSRLSANQLAPLELARLSPPGVSNPSDNLKNLFEIPTLFYVLVLYLFITRRVDGIYLASAWIFVGLRALHSVVHCTANIVLLRFLVYAASTTALWFMIGRATLNAM